MSPIGALTPADGGSPTFVVQLTVRAGPGGQAPSAFYMVNRFCVARLCGRAGRFTALFGGSRPGQEDCEEEIAEQLEEGAAVMAVASAALVAMGGKVIFMLPHICFVWRIITEIYRGVQS